MRLKLTLLGLGLALSGSACQGEAPWDTPPAKATHRPASLAEQSACEESTARGEPPAGGDCSRVPLDQPLFEDDPWGRWNCETMGNRICGPRDN